MEKSNELLKNMPKLKSCGIISQADTTAEFNSKR